MLEEDWIKMKLNEQMKVEFVAAGETRKAIFRATPRVKEEILNTSEFSAKGTLTAASAVPTKGRR